MTGRDILERELHLKFHADAGAWELLDHTAPQQLTPERQDILDCLAQSVNPMAPCEVAAALDQPQGSVRQLLFKLHRAGLVGRNEHSKYHVTTGNSSNGDHSGNGGNAGNDPS